MVAYYENEAAVIAALKRAKTPQEVIKIAQDLEQRMAPSHWIQRAVESKMTIIKPSVHFPPFFLVHFGPSQVLLVYAAAYLPPHHFAVCIACAVHHAGRFKSRFIQIRIR